MSDLQQKQTKGTKILLRSSLACPPKASRRRVTRHLPARRSLGVGVSLVFVAFTLAVLTLGQSVRAQNTTNNYTGIATGSVLTAGNWSLGHVPTVSEDAVFTATTGIRSMTAGSLTVGSWNVTASTGTFSIRNETSTATNRTLTLGGPGDLGNAVAPNSADLLYVASGATFVIRGDNPSGTGVLLLALGQSGNFDAVGTMTISSVISDGGSGFGITKTGAGTLTLAGANTYSGDTVLAGSSGTLVLSNTNALQNSTLNYTGSTLTFSSTVATHAFTFGGLKGSANIALQDNAGTPNAVALSVGNNNQDTTYSGSLTGTGSLTKVGTGTLILSGASSNYSGGTTVSNGLLQLNSSSALGSTSGTLTVNGGILDLNGQNISVGNFTGAGGTIWNNGPNAGSSTVTLTIGTGNNGGGNYAGVIQDNNGAAPLAKVALTKIGTGTITLSGTNTYTGATSVNGGTLFVNGSLATGSAVSVSNSGSVLGGTGTINGPVTVNANAAILGGTGATGQTLTLSNSLTMNSSSIIELALGASGAHSTLARTGSGTWSFQAAQAFKFIDLGATAGTTYNNIITGLASDPGTEATWTIQNAGWVGVFTYDGGLGAGNIDLTLVAVPEPSTWIAGGLALLAVGYTQRKRFVRLVARA